MNTVEVSPVFEPRESGMRNRSRIALKKRAVNGLVLRLAGAGGLTLLLLLFLTLTRALKNQTAEDLSIRRIEGIDPVSVEAPPPPPPPSEPPPPPPETPPLPKLDIHLDSIAPPIKATTEPQIELTMRMPDFSRTVEQPRQRMLFTSKELDQKPRLTNRPTARFPQSQLSRGVAEGHVMLEVEIDPAGKVKVRRVIDSNHPDFSEMAKTVASKARFTSPMKDGRAVSAVFRWPLLLKP